MGQRFKIKINMSNTDSDLENVIPVTEANLRDEQKQATAKAMKLYGRIGWHVMIQPKCHLIN